MTLEQIELASVPGIGKAKAKILQQAGYSSVEQIASAAPETIAALKGFSKKSTAYIISNAQRLIKLLQE